MRTLLTLWPWAVAGLVALTGLAALGSWWYGRHASAQIRSIAVLPFTGAGPQDAPEWFGPGLIEETIDALARLPGLRVAAGAQAGVEAVLQANFERAGDSLRITVRMIRAADSYRLWSATFQEQRQDACRVPRRIAAGLAQRLRISPAAGKPPRHNPPPAACDAFLEGRWFFERSRDKAAERFAEATRLDPEFASAWAWLSIATEYRVDADLARPNEAMPGARDAAERAVALDPDSGETHLALAIVKLQYDWDWAGAKRKLDQALELSPGSGLVRLWRARWYQTQGRPEDAARLGLATGPPPPEFQSAESAARQGDVSEAIRILDRADELRALNYLPAVAFTRLAAIAKDWDSLFQWLDTEYDERSVHLPYARLNPDIPQSDPRFAALLRKMNLPQ